VSLQDIEFNQSVKWRGPQKAIGFKLWPQPAHWSWWQKLLALWYADIWFGPVPFCKSLVLANVLWWLLQ